jgi:hypothetical protein
VFGAAVGLVMDGRLAAGPNARVSVTILSGTRWCLPASKLRRRFDGFAAMAVGVLGATGGMSTMTGGSSATATGVETLGVNGLIKFPNSVTNKDGLPGSVA